MAKRDYVDKKKDFTGFLSEGTNFNGTLSFSGTFSIDSHFEGEIVTDDTLIIGERAVISAEITAGTIYISGKVTGNISASERIEIDSTGEVYGNINTPVLVIAEGVIFEGNCKMTKEEVKGNRLAVIPNA